MHFPQIDIEEESPVWAERSWHYVRARILRLRQFPGTSVREAVDVVRSREASRKDRS